MVLEVSLHNINVSAHMSPRGFPCGCCSVLPRVCLDGQNQYQEAQNLGSQPLGSPQMVHTESGPSVNICCSLQSPAATVTRKPRPQLSTQSKTIYILLMRKNHLTWNRQMTHCLRVNKASGLGVTKKLVWKIIVHVILGKKCYEWFV